MGKYDMIHVPPCPVQGCGKQFSQFRDLGKHLLLIHPEDRILACSWCGGFHENATQRGRCKASHKRADRGGAP